MLVVGVVVGVVFVCGCVFRLCCGLIRCCCWVRLLCVFIVKLGSREVILGFVV